MASTAMFQGLVTDETGQTLTVAWVGQDACYVIDDDGFRRHIDAEQVDRQVFALIKEQIDAHRDIAVRSALEMLGKDDIFSKTAVEYSLNHMEEAVGQPIPIQAREMLKSVGFRIVIDERGDVVSLEMPEGDIDED
ncbi:MAG: hypothetical protein J5I90_15025 [Caldilineales bacterium]|nr:hypothetical protein [Caldilineales bacterium]